MHRRPAHVAIAAAVIAIAIAAGAALFVHHRHRSDPAAGGGSARPPGPSTPTTYEVDGQHYPCGNSGRIRLTASVQYPDPDASFTLDGQEQPTNTDAAGVVLQMIPAPVYSCTERRTHHLHIKSGQRNPFGPGCSINLESLDPMVLNGRTIVYQVPPFPRSEVCDLTWTA